MQNKIRRLGIGEILFGLVIILGIIGTVSLFVFDESLGIGQQEFIIISSLAFIGAFFILSIYARWIKRTHSRLYRVRKAVQAWNTYINTPYDRVQRPLPEGTIETIAGYFFSVNGYTPVTDRKPNGPSMFMVMDSEGRTGLVQSFQVQRPVNLREVVTFYEALRNMKANHGEIWSPAGFNDDAVQWVTKKPITLVAKDDIQEIVSCLPDV